MLTGELLTLALEKPVMEPSAYFRAPTACAESAEASDGSSVVAREGPGLGPVLIILMPCALAAWVAIGVAVYGVVT